MLQISHLRYGNAMFRGDAIFCLDTQQGTGRLLPPLLLGLSERETHGHAALEWHHLRDERNLFLIGREGAFVFVVL